MTTCTWIFRRHAVRVVAVALSAGLTSGLVVPRAFADQIGDLKAQAAAVEAKIQALGFQEDALSERYDAAEVEVQVLQVKVASAASVLAAAEITASKARDALKADALEAYVSGGQGPLAQGGGDVTSATEGILRDEYAATLASDQSDTLDSYRVALREEQAAETNLKAQQTAADASLRQVAADAAAVQSAANSLTSLENHIDGQVAVLVRQQEAAQAAAAAAAAAAARRQAAAAAYAAAQARQRAVAVPAAIASQPASQTATVSQPATAPQFQPDPLAAGPSTSFTPPPVGSGASGAVAAAESRLGDWYQWGAAGPTTFDCSGLVMWAYAQVGISLPHFSGAQYADTTHIPMSDLEPGDLVFFADPGEHVAMYIGNGEIIESPHTGAQVHIVPMYPEFVLASRVE